MSRSGGAGLLRSHLRPQRGALCRLAAWSAVEALPGFFSGMLVGRALDSGFLAGRQAVGFAWLGALAALWALSALGTRKVYPWLAATVEPLRDALLTALVTATLRRAVADGEGADGSRVSQATLQVETVRALFSALLRTVRQLVTGGLAALGGLLVLSPLLGAVVGAFVAVALVAFAALVRVLVVRYRAVVLWEERIAALAAPVVDGLRDVVAAGAEAHAAAQVGRAIDAEMAAARALARAQALRMLVVALGAHLPVLALLASAPALIAGGHLTVGQLAGAVVYLTTGLVPAVQLLVNAGGTIVVNLAVVLGRLAEVAGGPGTSGAAEPADGPALHPARGDVAFEGVTFAYSPRAEPVLREFDLDVPEGCHLAVVGPSGVGKSTLAGLLVRLCTPQAGSVRLGGVELAYVDEAHLRRTVALIPQEAYVFAATVRDNLRYLAPAATDADLADAAATVGASALVARLGGLDAALAPGGGGLSPGERQLIALTRVYASPARVVVLDEATCHLDPVAEARAEEAFARRPGTLVVIAHRISSALRADLVLLMDGARRTLGTHEDLLLRCGLYAELVGHWTGAARPPSAPVERVSAPCVPARRPARG